MQYRPYGKDGPQVSRLGFGVMRLPKRNPSDDNDVDFEASTRLMRDAMEAGVNLFDSHHRYHGGNSEVAIGKALAGWKGQHVHVQTKTPWYQEQPTEYFEKLLYEALEKLGVNCIDYLLHHSMNMGMWDSRGRKFIRFTDWAIRRGLIRHRGFSSHDTPENIKAFVDTGEFACMVVSYNWMNVQVRDAIAHAADRGMGVSIMNPLGGGVLATPTPQIMQLLPGAESASDIAMRYVLATPGVTCALSGMNASEQLDENLAVASRPTPLTADEQQQMQAQLDKLETKAMDFCTACGYCMPCEQGVDIPGVFGLYNRAMLFGQVEWARGQYGRLKAHKDGDKSAAACEQCGECQPKCPNNVPIIEQLTKVETKFGQ